MNNLDRELNGQLAAIREQGLLRRLHRIDSPQSTKIRIDGTDLLNFSSNDYLGLANDPGLQEAAIQAVERFGTGTGSSRLLSGSLAPHHELEETLAGFKGTEAALSFSSGYATALGVICSLLGKGDILILDKLVHACVVDAARLSGARLRVFSHNNLEDLESILKWAATQPAGPGSRRAAGPSQKAPRVLIVTESVFSMDGDQAPLAEIVALKNHYGAWLMLDEAHATGLYGKTRRGLAEERGVSHQIEIQMGTLGKAMGAAGGYVCGSRALIDVLINCARSFIFSTAPVPAAAAAAAAGVRFIASKAGADRCQLLWQRIEEFASQVRAPGIRPPGAIIPLRIGAESAAMDAAAALRKAGIFVPAIRYPTVARNQARLRVTLTAAHSDKDIQSFAQALTSLNLKFEI